jgi:hypothetical protein
MSQPMIAYPRRCFAAALLGLSVLLTAQTATGQERRTPGPPAPDNSAKPAPATPSPDRLPGEGAMTIEKLGHIIKRLDPGVLQQGAGWRFTIERVPVVVLTSVTDNRMRIMVAIRRLDGMTGSQMRRALQANFATTLDVRYALARHVLWAAYIHPLSELHPKQFIAAVAQTVNAAQSYGASYSSGLLPMGGDAAIARRQRGLIDRLLKRGTGQNPTD